jgi:capsular polysaccharide biosynthesis protein
MAEQQRTPTPYYDYPDDEISLYEVWNTLVRHRLLIGAVFVLAVMAASAYALTRTPTYVMEAVFEVGQMTSLNETSSDNTAGLQRIEEPNVLVTQLNAVIIPEVMDTEAMQGLPAPKASVLNKEAGLVRLSNSIPAELSEKQQRSMQAVLQAIIDRHDAMIGKRKAEGEARTERALINARKELELAQGIIRSLTPAMEMAKDAAFRDDASFDRSSQHPVSAYSDLVRTIHNARSEIFNIQTAIERLESVEISVTPTRLIRASKLGPATNGRSTTTLIGLGAVLGLMVGVFAAFGREFLIKAAEQRKELNDA